MLAEDDEDDVQIFRFALDVTKMPYTLRHAADADRMFSMLEERIPYILFLDINMPCKDGNACILEIRKNKEYDNLPVVMYSSYHSDKTVDTSFRNGANLYLAKTAVFDNLVNNLKRIFSIDWKRYLHYASREQFILR